MENKEKIIIDDIEEKVNILFECNHIDDLQAYELIKNGIEITPENAPICNFKIKIVSNTKSPYGFYTIFQKDPKKDEWEYMGIGNSGASSLITALLKAHEMGLKRISDLEKRIIKHSDEIEEYCSRLADKDHECEELKKRNKDNERFYLIQYAKKDSEVLDLTHKLNVKTQECEKLKEEQNEIKKFLGISHKTIVQRLEELHERSDKYKDIILELEQECEQKEKEINELHLIIDRLLEASGYDKNISTAEDFEDVYADIDYKLGLLDELKQECEELKDKIRIKDDENSNLNKKYRQEQAEKFSYRKALKEIEEVWAKDEDGDYDFVKWRSLDIINKAKDRSNEN